MEKLKVGDTIHRYTLANGMELEGKSFEDAVWFAKARLSLEGERLRLVSDAILGTVVEATDIGEHQIYQLTAKETSLKQDPDFIEKRFYWGTCYGMFDPERKSAVIITQRETPAETRRVARELLSTVKAGTIAFDAEANAWRTKMQEWGISG